MKRLPDAEFEIMKRVWDSTPPITTATIMESLGREKGWKAQTIITLMLRLVEHGFLRTEKKGRERSYFPLIARDDYLKYETENFVQFYHDNSFSSLLASFMGEKSLTESDLAELKRLVEKLGENEKN